MPHRKAQQHQGIGLGKIPTKYSLLVLLATIFLIIVATIGGKNLYFRGDYDIFFDGTNKQLLAFDEIRPRSQKRTTLPSSSRLKMATFLPRRPCLLFRK